MKATKYKTIVIDPPWPGPGETWSPKGVGETNTFRPNARTKKWTSSVIPYSTMTGIQCAALNVPELTAEAGQLFLWAPSRHIGDAYLLLQLWGFRYRGLFVWKKPLGMGRHMRHQCEFILWGGRPGARLVEPKACPTQFHEWKKPKRHSEKPPEAYELMRRLSDAPRLDIFARQSRPGFVAWGNQAPIP